jgi:hypothetical protein
MVTNINLVSPEEEKKSSLSGKNILVLSASILIVVFALLAVVVFLKNKYLADEKQASAQVEQQQNLLSGKEYLEIADFQSRLNLIEKIIGDHSYWDVFLKKMSGYVIPDTKLGSFSGKMDSTGLATVDVAGMATNNDTASRELILLKDFPGASSLEFGKMGIDAGQAEGQSAVLFGASLKIEKKAFQK